MASSVHQLASRTVDNLLCEEDGTQEQVKSFMKSYTTAHPIGPHPASADVDEDRMLRGVKVLNKYYLFVWDTYQRHGNHNYLGYRFVDPKGYILFQGTDYGIPQQEAIDSDSVVSGLLKWFIIDPKEQDAAEECFTPEQLEFLRSEDAEELGMALIGHAEGEGELPFIDLPGYEHGEDEE